MSQTIHKAPAARPTSVAPRVLAVAAALLLAFVALFATASPAQAHDELIGSSPAADSSLDALPAELTLTFSAQIAGDEGASEIQVTDASGTSLVDGAPSAQDNVLTQPLAGEASGVVTVLWKVVSSDGHPISGELSFTVTAAPEPTPTGTTEPTPTETVGPTPTPTETAAAPSPGGGSGATMWIWIISIAGILAATAIAYLIASRARREKALAEASPGASQPGSDTPADQ